MMGGASVRERKRGEALGETRAEWSMQHSVPSSLTSITSPHSSISLPLTNLATPRPDWLLFFPSLIAKWSSRGAFLSLSLRGSTRDVIEAFDYSAEAVRCFRNIRPPLAPFITYYDQSEVGNHACDVRRGLSDSIRHREGGLEWRGGCSYLNVSKLCTVACGSIASKP